MRRQSRRRRIDQLRLNDTVELLCLVRLSRWADAVQLESWQFYMVDDVAYCVGRQIRQFSGLATLQR
jgi:hypothetical protein